MSEKEKEIKKLEEKFNKFDDEVKSLTLDRMNAAPAKEEEKQTKLSSNQIKNSKDIYIKPDKTIADRQKFNESFRDEWKFQKEYVQFIAENKEIIGETLEFWTHPFGGVGAEFWKIPTNKPIWAPRYVAEQIARKKYHRLIMQDKPHSSDGNGTYYGTMAVDSTIQRLDAYPVREKRSNFGNSGF